MKVLINLLIEDLTVVATKLINDISSLESTSIAVTANVTVTSTVINGTTITVIAKV